MHVMDSSHEIYTHVMDSSHEISTSTLLICFCTSILRLKKGLKQPSVYHTVTSAQGAYQQWQVQLL